MGEHTTFNTCANCLLTFQYWAGIFDNEGRLLDKDGQVIFGDSSEESLPTPLSQLSKPISLTTENLDLKDLSEALDKVQRRDSKNSSPRISAAGAQHDDANYSDKMLDLETVSTFSPCGSFVPSMSGIPLQAEPLISTLQRRRSAASVPE